MPIIEIIIKNKGVTRLECESGELISDILARAGLSHPRPCGGRGVCGKCTVTAEGKLSQPDPEERAALSASDLSAGVRLACRARIAGDARIHADDPARASEGMLYAPDKFDGESDGESVINTDKSTRTHNPAIPLVSREKCYGAVVDIGTTTVAAYLFRFPGGDCVGKRLALNAQAVFGADVMTRVSRAVGGGAEELCSAVRSQVGGLLSEFEADIGEPLDKVVITGNTAMLLLYTQTDASGLAASPFIPARMFGDWEGRVYYPGCISAFVGADITTAILACKMPPGKISLLADIGTNGEMVLYDGGGDGLQADGKSDGGIYYCCSCAAGPAFEGAGISAGVPAAAGAVNKVYVKDGAVGFTTVGGAPPAGICGSGLVDAVACMIELGVLEETGYLEEDFEIGGTAITPGDIRQVQLAKSAVCSGIDTLLHELNLSCDQVDHFYVAGGFGNALDAKSAAAIGLIPGQLLDKLVYIGNGAAAGAAMILRDRGQYDKSKIIIKNTRSVDLAGSGYFADKFMENMMFL